jgi:hypothetical protein
MTARSTVMQHRTLLALLLLMAATRFHHEGTGSLLPDASLAVFFLAGLWQIKRWGVACLLAAAALIDAIAIQQWGVSDFCLTPAYAFLLPTYAVMVWGGAVCKGLSLTNVRRLGLLGGTLLAATSAAFAVSTSSFYLLSGLYASASLADYLTIFGGDVTSYVSITLLYSAVAVGGRWLMGSLLNAVSTSQHA